jgi:altronate dehydratase
MSYAALELFDDLSPRAIPLKDAVIRLHPDDEVAIARMPLPPGTVLTTDSGEAGIQVSMLTPAGHKLALRDIPAGQPVHRYGQIIGFATRDISTGEHVHTHNLGVQDFAREPISSEVEPVAYVPEHERRAFLGYQRSDGRVGTRNYVAVISTVNCSAHTTRRIVRHFQDDLRALYPNVDGVIGLTHAFGCAHQINGPDYRLLQRTLAGMAQHPNIGAYLLVGLGCEVNQMADLIANYALSTGEGGPPCLTIQDMGGIRKTVEAGIAAVNELLPVVNASQRTTQPISDLVLALQCGGSDGWSGITANPALGLAADEVVRQGGTVVLAETPEIYGAEHLLVQRAISQAVRETLLDKVRWWEEHTRQIGAQLDNNPSVGNRAGGLTTIFEKSLGAIAKGGSTPLMAVYDYAERITARGLTFMDTPGYDPVAVTGQVAGGSTLVLFTTGRGSVFGFKPAPCIKISTNSQMYERMMDDMDVDAGQIANGRALADVAAEILNLVVAVASGQPSKSEAQDVGEAEFNPWNLGGTL